MRFLMRGAAMWAATVLFVLAAGADDKKKDAADEVVINITGNGGKAKYIKAGDTAAKDVTVVVGQTVKWVNKGNKTHTATSSLKVGDKAVFDTGDLRANASGSVTFDEQKYKDAGGKDGKAVTLEYYCTVHGKENMKSNLILMPTEPKTAAASAADRDDKAAGARTFDGESKDGKLQEALDKALEQLDKALSEGGVADAQAAWKVADVTGTRGGMTGAKTVKVKISATRTPPWVNK